LNKEITYQSCFVFITITLLKANTSSTKMFANVFRQISARMTTGCTNGVMRAPSAQNMIVARAPQVAESTIMRQPEVAEATFPVIIAPLALFGIAFYKQAVYGETEDAMKENTEFVKRMRAAWKEEMPQSTVEGGLKRTTSWKDNDSTRSVHFNKEPVRNRIDTLMQLNVKNGQRQAAPEYKDEQIVKEMESANSRGSRKFGRTTSITWVDGVSNKYQ
jgi:hypothetical protein